MNNTAHRLFIALPLDEGIRAALKKPIDDLRVLSGAVKAVESHNLHITMKFLGDTDSDRLNIIKDRLLNLKTAAGPIAYSVKGMGAFPSISDPSVIWCGLTTDMDRMHSLFRKLKDMVSDLGFPEEKRSFTPHITLARMRRGTNVPHIIKEYLKTHAGNDYGESQFRSIILYESLLTKTGPVYTKITEKILGTDKF